MLPCTPRVCVMRAVTRTWIRRRRQRTQKHSRRALWQLRTHGCRPLQTRCETWKPITCPCSPMPSSEGLVLVLVLVLVLGLVLVLVLGHTARWTRCGLRPDVDWRRCAC